MFGKLLGALVVIGVVAIGWIAQHRYGRRDRIRVWASREAMVSPPDWKPVLGQVARRDRVAPSPDHAGELLRATVAKYDEVARQQGCAVIMKQMHVDQSTGKEVAGWVTFCVEPISETRPTT